MSGKYKVLVVDDETAILELLEYNLRKEGYLVRTSSDGRKALADALSFVPDLIILDIMMPELDGVETCRLIRNHPDIKHAYILFLTARSEEFSEIAAFEAGANDFIIKPVKPRALLSRISTALRRNEMKLINDDPVVSVRNITIDKDSFKVIHNGREIILTKKEFEILYFLSRNPDKVFNRDDLLRFVWGEDIFVVNRTVDVHIRKIREKLGNEIITTVKGIGYKLESKPS